MDAAELLLHLDYRDIQNAIATETDWDVPGDETKHSNIEPEHQVERAPERVKAEARSQVPIK